jgi:hypothetical protein
MIHYHGGPITPQPVGLAVWQARHAMVSYARPDQISLAAEICQSFTIDNGAFSIWTQGGKLDAVAYMAFVQQWAQHPSFDWALIPDVIDGSEEQNDHLISVVERQIPWPIHWVPVWHLHESLTRLETLVKGWPRIALGSSGEYADPGAKIWWHRISEAMEVCCDKQGRPKTRLHGLRMMDPTIFSHIPFASVDSTSVARNSGMDVKWTGRYPPLSEETRALVLVDRIEHHASSARWSGSMGVQKNLELVG